MWRLVPVFLMLCLLAESAPNGPDSRDRCSEPLAHLAPEGGATETRPEVQDARYEYVVRAVHSPAAAVSGDGKRILVTDELITDADMADRAAHIWNVAQGGKLPLSSLSSPHEKPIHAASFFPQNNNRLVTASGDGTIRFWDLSAAGAPRNGRTIRLPMKRGLSPQTPTRRGSGKSRKLISRPQFAQSLQFRTDEKWLATNFGNSVFLIDPKTGKRVAVISANEGNPSIDSEHWDQIDSADRAYDSVVPHSDLTAFALSRNGKMLVTASYTDGGRLSYQPQVFLRLYDLVYEKGVEGLIVRQRYERRIFGDKGPITKIRFSPLKMDILITARNSLGRGYIQLWSSKNGELEVSRDGRAFTHSHHMGPIEDIIITRGTHLEKYPSVWVVPQGAGPMTRWKLAGGRYIGTYGPTEDEVKIIHSGTTYDGRYVWTISMDRVFRVYNVETDVLVYESQKPEIDLSQSGSQGLNFQGIKWTRGKDGEDGRRTYTYDRSDGKVIFRDEPPEPKTTGPTKPLFERDPDTLPYGKQKPLEE